MTYDSIIIGKGPAGISAAVYLVRAGKSVLVIGKDLGALERADRIENYYGFPEPVTGSDLATRGIAQAERLGVTIVEEEAFSLGIEDYFVVKTSSVDGEKEYRGKTVLLATGKQRAVLKVPGFDTFRGSGISFCATCDGFFYKGKKLGVVGTGDYAASELLELRHFSKDIILFTDGKELSSKKIPEDIVIVTEKIASFEGGETLSAVVTADGKKWLLDGVFVAVGTAGAADFAAKLGVEVEKTDIVVSKDFSTSIPGIFAAGDCTGGYLQIAKAVSDGALVAKTMVFHLKTLA